MTQRSTIRRICRPDTQRHSTRMINGARRPRPTNYLKWAIRGFEQAMRIHKTMLPFFEQMELQEKNRQWLASWEPAFRKAYGPATASPPYRQTMPPLTPKELRRHKDLIEKSDRLIAILEAALARKR